MARNASGTYTLPSGNPVVSGTLIDATWANNTLSDLGNEMTDSLSRSGEGAMLAPLRITDGVQATPSLAFSNEPSSGLYRAGSNEWWAVAAGVQNLRFTNTGLTTRAAAGAVGTPSIAAFNDTDTGIYFPGANELAIATGGAARMTFDSAGAVAVPGTFSVTGNFAVDTNVLFVDAASNNVGIGTASPGSLWSGANKLVVGSGSAAAGLTIYTSTSTAGTLAFGDGTTGSDPYVGYVQYNHTDNTMSLGTSGTTKATLDSSGNLSLGMGGTAAAYRFHMTDTLGFRANSANIVGMKGSGFGYAPSGYTALVIGATGTTTQSVCIGYDPSGNPSGSFSGDGSEIVLRNFAQFIQPTAANTNFHRGVISLRDGNVGIQSDPTGWSGYGIIQIGDNLSSGLGFIGSDAAGSTVTDIGHGAYWDGSNWKYTANSIGAARYRMTGANVGSTHQWFTSSGGTAGNNISFGDAKMTLDASGNLLLGGTSTTQLDGVFGQIIGSSTKSTAGIALETQYGAYMLYTDSDDSLIFYDSGDNAPRAKITSGGNFYVGTTTGSYRIQSTVASGADQDMFLSGVTGVTNGVYWKWVNSTSKINVYFSALPTTASAANAYIDNAAGDQLLRSTSSIRYKKDIEDIDHEFADAALNLRPVWYRSKADSDNKDWSWYGLIAEEVAEVEPRLVHWAYPEDAFDVETVDDSIKKTVKEGAKRVPDGVQYERLSVLLLDIVKRQNARIESLEAKVAALEAK